MMCVRTARWGGMVLGRIWRRATVSMLWAWALALVSTPALCASARSFDTDTVVVTLDTQDPLNRLLWAGDPAALWATWPASVALVLVPKGEPDAAPAEAALAAALTGSQQSASKAASGAPTPRAVAVKREAELPPSVREALQRFGHEQRVVTVSGRPELSMVGLGDSGIGLALSADGAAWRLALYGHEACQDAPPSMPIQGRAVLIRRGGCPYVDKVRRARAQGAAAVIFVNNDLTLNRVAGACPECGDVALAAVPKAAGEALWAAVEAANGQGSELTVSLSSRRAWPMALRVSADDTISEVGTVPYAFNHLLPQPIDPFESLAHEAQHLAHLSQRRQQMQQDAESGRLRVLPVFQGQRVADPQWTGQRTRVVTAMPMDWLQRAHQLSWDLSLGCEGPLKSQCPPWDYIVQMTLCENAQAVRCGWEVGRWITPYWSGGSWLHDATPLIGLLKRAVQKAPRDAQGRALLTWEFHSIQPYLVQASLRFLMGPARAGVARPLDASPLPFPGGAMTDGTYAQRQGAVVVQVPQGMARVSLATMITGHGFADDDKCAEFCNTEHHLQVDNAPAHVLSQPESGTDKACAQQVGQGVVPNQGGTWVNGRNGWCPGDAVRFREIDISAEVAAARAREPRGASALPPVEVRVRYRSLVKGVDHQPPARNAQGREPDARLDVSMYAVFYGQEGAFNRARGRSGPPGPARPGPARRSLAAPP